MLHEPASQSGKDPAAEVKKKLGLQMFALYCIAYVGFVLINLINPLLMEKTVLAGLNLAVVYGFGLIVFALVLALVYNHMCTKRERRMESDGEATE